MTKKTAILIPLTHEDKAEIKKYAEKERRSVCNYLITAGLERGRISDGKRVSPPNVK